MDTRQRLTLPLIIALAAALAPEAVRLPPWITAWCAGLWGYLAWVVKTGRPWPRKWTKTGLTLAGLLMVAAGSGRTFDGKDFVSLLAVMAAVKPYEIQTHRDRMITVFLAYFTVITCLFDLESLAMTLYLFVSVLITTAVLIQVNRPDGELKPRFRLAGLILVQALPLTLLLFTLFPRLQGNLWGRPAAAASGLSSTLNPGDIASLVLSEEVAFKADFDGDIPPPAPALLAGRRVLAFQRDHVAKGRLRLAGTTGPGRPKSGVLPGPRQKQGRPLAVRPGHARQGLGPGTAPDGFHPVPGPAAGNGLPVPGHLLSAIQHRSHGPVGQGRAPIAGRGQSQGKGVGGKMGMEKITPPKKSWRLPKPFSPKTLFSTPWLPVAWARTRWMNSCSRPGRGFASIMPRPTPI